MTTAAPNPQLSLSVEETATLLGAGLRQTYEAVRRGDIPAVKIGARWYVKAAALYAMFGTDEAALRPQSARSAAEPHDSGPIEPTV
ncbi:helix-turn-helix domain-containing protein [Microbacterium sp. SORGH_AS_0888]|uniref:helix-turn-helix domain-containing protein n=1 Tax=Microbacterium sp. SORGH_AS_0888 TaxID=3041791 RepID=UPI002780842C|nr:helix-turn-helix domain-containing protein [Microbacterium sp. SORGH_AS_0888]MDQ1128279.1 excisionase family DNA binding protein [Microbacterium sp. SORGH_AS_0888]